MGDGEVAELLKIANGNLPRVRLEYGRVIDEINWCKAALNNEVRVYQDFCDRNLGLYKREGELKRNIDELEAKKTEVEKTTAELQRPAEVHENNVYNDNLNLEIKQEDVIFSNDVFIRPSNMVIDYNHPNEEGTLHHPSKVGPSSGTLIFDTKDLL